MQYNTRLDLIEVREPPSSDSSVILAPPEGSIYIDHASPALTGDNDVMCAAQCILNQRELKGGVKQFLVRSVDSRLTDTWEDERNLSGEFFLHWLLSIPGGRTASSYITSRSLTLQPGGAYRRTRNGDI